VAYFLSLALMRRRVREPVARWAMLQVAVLAGFSWYVPVVLGWFAVRARSFWIPRLSVHQIAASYATYSGSAALLIIFAILAVIGAARRGLRASLPVLLCWMLIPVVVPVAISMIRNPLFLERYAIASAAPMYILVAAGL